MDSRPLQIFMSGLQELGHTVAKQEDIYLEIRQYEAPETTNDTLTIAKNLVPLVYFQ
jgi:hypothetical protein